MDCSPCLPQSVFNTQANNMVDYLEQCQKGDVTQLHKRVHKYQVDAVLEVRRYFEKEPQTNSITGMVVLPTGCDSNGVAVMTAYALNASRVLVVTPHLAAAKQIYKSFSAFLLDHGVIKEKDKQKMLPSKSIVTNDSQLNEAMTTSVTVINASKMGGKCSVKIDHIPSDNNDLVIVNEAQYYPQSTWQLITKHFSTSRLLFFSTTAQHNGRPILKDIHPCYKLEHTEAVNRGIIRDVKFDKLVGGDDNYAHLVSEIVQL